MRNKKLLLLASVLSLVSLVGCNKDDTPKTIKINIGTKLQTVNEIESDQELDLLLSSLEKEGIMLATYSKIRVESCGCGGWTAFREDVLNRYVRHYNVPIYYFNTDLLSDLTANKYGLVRNPESDPEFYLFQEQKLVKKYKHDDKVKNIFQWERFESEMKEKVVKPATFSMFYVTEDYLFDQKNLENAEKAILLNERNACGDCSYLIPNYLVPFTQENQIKQEIWVIDIQKYNINGNDSGEYKNIISKLQLSEASNQTFGFGRGFVPTIQYYEKGELKDAAVTFNDNLVEENENYVIEETYYTAERLENLSFLKNSDVETKILQGKQVEKADVEKLSFDIGSFLMWSHDGAMKFHKPILDAFLKTYSL